MRTNLPVTNTEYVLRDDQMIVSKTDLKGRITYINKDFLDISGFSEQELIGEPHNLVRHPDMPTEAFQDMWDTLKAGRPWVGYVKNRCKNGDFYWVEAHAAPIWENGQITGYMSVRQKPLAAKIQAAEGAYRLFREKRQGSMRIKDGWIDESSNLAKTWRDISLGKRLAAGFSMMMLIGLIVAIVSVIAISQLQNEFTQYEKQSVAKERLAYQGSIQVGNAVHYFKNSLIRRGGEYPAKFEESMLDIGRIISEYKALGSLTQEEEISLSEITQGANAYRAAISQVVQMLSQDANSSDIDKSIKGADKPIANAFKKLAEINSKLSLEKSKAFEDRVATARITLISTTILMLILGIVISRLMTRNITAPFATIKNSFRNLSSGNYKNQIDVARNDDIGQILQGLETMQNRLGFELAETKRIADEMTRIKIALDNVSSPVRIADSKGLVIYANNQLKVMLRRIEPQLKAQNPLFSVDTFVGSSIGNLYADPEAALKRLAALTQTAEVVMDIGGRTFRVVTSPVFASNGDRIGSVGEWQDRTDELLVEKEVESIVYAAAQGDFSRRLTLEGKTGFFLSLANGLNSLLETSATGLEEVADVLNSLSQGDLTRQVGGDYQGTFGQLKDDTNLTINQLKNIIQSIQDASDLINTAAKEIAAGNTDLSGRTEEQASSLEETASSMEELSSTVKQNAASAGDAHRMTEESRQAVEDGSIVFHKVVETMKDIHTSSSKITDIIGVIDGIAFQTNILALNAAVEAARAGEQGRGFAVVATEVRSLAQRSAAAAKEIKVLIEASSSKVNEGTHLVSDASKAMESVKDSIMRVTRLVGDIASASVEQSAGIGQVSLAISQMDEVTQQNAALVEEAAAAAESLEDQAQTLNASVSIFRLDSGGHSTPLVSSRPAVSHLAQAAKPAPRKPAASASSHTVRSAPPSAADDGEDEWAEF